MESSRARDRVCPSRRRSVLSVALASAVVVGGTAVGTVYVQARAHGDTVAVSSSLASSGSASVDWGVSAAGSAFALKNGWLPRSTTGLWDINSIGRVTVDGHAYLVCVLSDGNPTKTAGVGCRDDRDGGPPGLPGQRRRQPTDAPRSSRRFPRNS